MDAPSALDIAVLALINAALACVLAQESGTSTEFVVIDDDVISTHEEPSVLLCHCTEGAGVELEEAVNVAVDD